MRALVAATWQMVIRLAGPGWFIAGDAAAALDPAAGSGIAFALRSGLAAGRAIEASLCQPRKAPLIAARYHGALAGEFETGARILVDNYRRQGIRFLAHTRLGDDSPMSQS